jgi:two-component system OmpR family response regulator
MTNAFENVEADTLVNGATLRTARIVVVDDDEDARSLIVAALKRDGHEVLAAPSGLEALSRVSSMMLAGLDQPDLIVTDVRMRGVDGLALISGLRLAGCVSPVVIMSAYDSKPFRERAERLGVVAFFTKPIDIDDLRTVVVNIILSSSMTG